MPPAGPKQQIIERLRQANTVLVTVSANPSVDQLAACIGMTLLLNKAGKHATAVFSGKVPSTIEFLQPEKTLEQNTDSLQDFIIALDKSKADKLRYKVENDVVKIFITPYRTSLSEKDLEFSKGDFNVEVVLALGVQKKEDLDQVILAHGRILHDATVISVMRGSERSQVGSINWQEPLASSLAEMAFGIGEGLQAEIDAQSATALLTGIVAETDRFSNQRTTPQVMNISARLMSSGANQQLIANKLTQQVEATLKPKAPAPAPVAGTAPAAVPVAKSEHEDEGVLSIKHAEDEISIDQVGKLEKLNDLEQAKQPPSILPEPSTTPPVPPTPEPLTTPASAPPVPETKPPTPPANNGRLLTDKPPDVGLTANTVPEHNIYEPSSDPMTMANAYKQPLLSRHKEPPVNNGPMPVASDEPVATAPTPAPSHVDEARAAVEKASLGVDSPNQPPIQALNANPLGGPLNPPKPVIAPPVSATTPQVVNSTAPPPVPPPMMPQFFDNNGQSDNPFANLPPTPQK